MWLLTLAFWLWLLTSFGKFCDFWLLTFDFLSKVQLTGDFDFWLFDFWLLTSLLEIFDFWLYFSENSRGFMLFVPIFWAKKIACGAMKHCCYWNEPYEYILETFSHKWLLIYFRNSDALLANFRFLKFLLTFCDFFWLLTLTFWLLLRKSWLLTIDFWLLVETSFDWWLLTFGKFWKLSWLLTLTFDFRFLTLTS